MADLAVAALASVEPEPLNLEAVIGFNGMCRWQHIMLGMLHHWVLVYGQLVSQHQAATCAWHVLSGVYHKPGTLLTAIILHTYITHTLLSMALHRYCA